MSDAKNWGWKKLIFSASIFYVHPAWATTWGWKSLTVPDSDELSKAHTVKVEIRIHPKSVVKFKDKIRDFKEFLKALGEDDIVELTEKNDINLINVFADKLKNYLKQYFYIGGMPEIVETYIKTNNAFCVENGNSNGIYIARTKVDICTRRARNEGYPFLVKVEQ